MYLVNLTSPGLALTNSSGTNLNCPQAGPKGVGQDARSNPALWRNLEARARAPPETQSRHFDSPIPQHCDVLSVPPGAECTSRHHEGPADHVPKNRHILALLRFRGERTPSRSTPRRCRAYRGDQTGWRQSWLPGPTEGNRHHTHGLPEKARGSGRGRIHPRHWHMHRLILGAAPQ